MELIDKSRELLSKIDSLLSDKQAAAAAAMPDLCYYLNQDEVLCLPRENGDARYPYCYDGFNMWAYSSGYISINESTFYVVLNADDGKEPFLNFYGAQQCTDGSGYVPISLLGVAKSQLEFDVARYTVFAPSAVYYLTVTPTVNYCVRAFVTKQKEVTFSVSCENKTENTLKTYLSGYFNCFLMHAPNENVETKWFKQCKTTENGFTFYSVEDISRTQHLDNYGVISRSLSTQDANILTTTCRRDYTGGKNNYLAASTSLREGKFKEGKSSTKFTETAVAGDIVHINIAPKGNVRMDYRLCIASNQKDASTKAIQPFSAEIADKIAHENYVADIQKFEAPTMLKMTFNDGDGTINGNVLTHFMRFVTRQVEFAALSKNSGVSLLGVRDVFQQLEAALMWNAKDCRAKILEGLSFLGEDGRPPRQYSIPPVPGAIPQLDLRLFIDQGVWIINTVYRYLAYTGDYSILDEVIGYYKFNGDVKISADRDSVLCHLVRIVNFLTSNIDQRTSCLHVLYGDWNDALDGMGVSKDKSKPYGTGVSVMTTLQLYGNLCEMEELLAVIGKPQLINTAEIKQRLKKGLTTFAIENNMDGRRILHGWGDERSYFVGSSCDSDNQDRVGLTSNAFWAISGAYEWDKSIKKDILNTYQKLDSKYGLKTFEPYFAPGTPGVGRIVNLPKGTAENSATYIHATLFGIWSLFLMNESKLAWQQLDKAMPISHKHISTSQFIMSNSYSLNDEFGMDGESMSDWYTGSANVLMKVMVRNVFGVDAMLSQLKIMPCNYMPFNNAEISLKIRDCLVTLTYKKVGNSGKRVFLLNGNPVSVPQCEIPCLAIPYKNMPSTLNITVEDK